MADVLGNRVDKRKVGRSHFSTAQMYEEQAVWLAAMGGGWFSGQAIISLHYALLHYLDAYLVGVRAIHCTSHDEQDAAIASLTELTSEQVGEFYKIMRGFSEDARYRMRKFTRAEYQEYKRLYFARVKEVLIKLVLEARLVAGRDARVHPTLLTRNALWEEAGEAHSTTFSQNGAGGS